MLKFAILCSALLIGCEQSNTADHQDSASDSETEIETADATTDSANQTDSANPNQRTTDDDTETASDTDNSPAIFSKYGNLSTLAGACHIEDKGINGWQTSFEGGPATQAELSRPHYAMADNTGNIYIADKDAHAVRMVDTNGNIHTIAGTSVAGNGPDVATTATQSALNGPNGLWVLGDGTVYIVDLNNNKIRRRRTDEKMETVVTDEGGISLGRAVWVSEDESVLYYSSGSVVKKWTPKEGITIFATGFNGLGALMMGADGNLMVADRVGNAVYRVTPDGTAQRVAGTGAETSILGSGAPATSVALAGVRAIWVLAEGDYFIATHEGSQVWYVDTDGIIHLFVDGADNDGHAGDGAPFNAPGPKVSEVRGIACDREGNLIITENDCGYIRRVERFAE